MKNLFRKLFYRLTPKGRIFIRRVMFWPLDIWESVIGKRGPMTPPRGMIYTGSGNFLKQGELFRDYFEKYAGLRPGSKVLDVGSGIGRMAIPLTNILDQEKGGFYEGFDVVKSGVDWCSKKIQPSYPHFSFRYIPLKNDLYRADGETAENLSFPYPDEYFDLVILTSVFTHMLPPEVQQYLKEIHRVLMQGGKVFATFFIWEDGLPTQYDPNFSFPFDHGHYRLMDEKVKAANVAYNKNWLFNKIDTIGLKIDQELNGNWCERENVSTVDFQDILVLGK